MGETQQLPYEQPTGERSARQILVLCALPLAAGGLGLLTGMFGIAEPFFVLKATDAAVFFGAPVAIVALGIVWCRLALARRVRWIVIVPVLGWFALMAAGAVQETPLSGLYLSHVLIGKSAARALGQAR